MKYHFLSRFFALSCLASMAILSFGADGDLDLGFDPGSGANDDVRDIIVQPDGKILICGDFKSVNGVSRPGIARLNANGSLDTEFTPGNGADNAVLAMALQPDGKIVIVGRFTKYNTTDRIRIARLESNGFLDTGFDPGDGANFDVNDVVVLPDGKIVIGGVFTNIDGASQKAIARLETDGSHDTSFSTGSGPNADVNEIALQSDGKILIGGSFDTVDDETRNDIARLYADGSLDYSFDPGDGIAGGGSLRDLVLQADGKIVIGGFFSEVAGTARRGIARFDTNGSHDLEFDPGTGADGQVESIALQPDGKIVIGGNFPDVDQTPRVNVARLDPDGSHDLGFDPGESANDRIYALAVQPDGKILVGGNFTTFDGIGRNRIARLDGTPPAQATALGVDNSALLAMLKKKLKKLKKKLKKAKGSGKVAKVKKIKGQIKKLKKKLKAL